MTIKYYTGVGSRNILPQEQKIIKEIARMLAEEGYTLRSGKADGADTAFIEGAIEGVGNYENYLPWKDFNGKHDSGHDYCYQWSTNNSVSTASTMAKVIHPNWEGCSDGAKHLHTRNIMQVLGSELTQPSEFLLACSSEDINGDVTGGTRTAWMMARLRGIPVFNIRHRTIHDVVEWLYHIGKL